jgi:hypothetical protein
MSQKPSSHQRGIVPAGSSVRDLDAAMQKLRNKLQEGGTAAGGSAGKAPAGTPPSTVWHSPSKGQPASSSTAGENDWQAPRPTTAQLSQQATAILQQIEDFDLFAHVQQKKTSAPAPPARSDSASSKPRSSPHLVANPSGKPAQSAGSKGAAVTFSEGCGSNDPIPDDAPAMSDAVMQGGAHAAGSSSGQIGVDDLGHPGTVYRLVGGTAGRSGAGGSNTSSKGAPLSWQQAPQFIESLRSVKTMVYFDYLLECIRQDQKRSA